MRPIRDCLAANEDTAKRWLNRITSFDHIDGRRSRVEEIASRHRSGKSCRVIQRVQGAFNYCFRLRFDEDNQEWILRFPVPGDCMDPVRKIQGEVAVMHFIKEKTTIPIPRIIASGIAEEDFLGLGPYIIMEFIDGIPLDDLILGETEWKLQEDIPDSRLELIYRQIADIYLQLFTQTFPRIGALSMEDGIDEPVWSISSGPVTFKMNEIERMGGVQVKASKKPYDTAMDYFDTLIEQSFRHLHKNVTTMANDEEAYEDFKNIHTLKAMSDHFVQKLDCNNLQNKLFCDDLRFGNILVDKSYKIVAVIDWEFCYAAPASFLYSPPAWLIGTEPFEWSNEDTSEYENKLKVFLEILVNEEKRREIGHTLSDLMRQSKSDGTFWFNLAIRESFPLTKIMKHCVDTEPFREYRPLKDMSAEFRLFKSQNPD